ncbi:AP-4 complex accessory subunit tepsin-like [Antedon mediterranea]|uniref:AP-4 complex accessory subunit tepsin-like n=1 Tax=Antedon mediterranea TaxID=105859 RepID=UPI003AF9B6FC
MAGITSKFLLLNKMNMLVKATSDDASPTPGYLYEEITNLTCGTPGQTLALLDFLVNRLEIQSCYVKLKVLNVMIRVVQYGHPPFAAGLRRNATGINKATMHSGPPHATCDNAPYVAVRKAATQLSSILFDTEKKSPSTSNSINTVGYGVNKSKKTMGGFGNTQTVHEKTLTDQLKNGFQQLAGSFSATENITQPRAYKAMHGDTNKSYSESMSMYKGDLIKHTTSQVTIPTKQDSTIVENPDLARLTYKGGKAGGGWEEDGSSDGISSDLSNGSTPLSEKLQAAAVVEDWIEEAKCVEDIVTTNEGRSIPSRQELDELEGRCDTLNCDKVLEFLIHKIARPENVIKMRALCAIERLVNTDLLGHDIHQLHSSLQDIISSQETSKQAVSKAKKILRLIQSTAKQDEIRNILTTQQPKVSPATMENLDTSIKDLDKNLLSNLDLINHSKEDPENAKSNLPHSETLTHLVIEQNKSINKLDGEKTQKSVDSADTIPLSGQNMDLQTGHNLRYGDNPRIIGQNGKQGDTIANVKDSIEETDSSINPSTTIEGCVKEPEKTYSSNDLLSDESNIGDLLTSLNFKTDVKIASGRPKERTPLNQMQTSTPLQMQQSLDKNSIAAMFPQLSTSNLSGTSALPLQLGRQSAGFDFVGGQNDTKAKPKAQEKFDFVQEAMKSAIRK